MVKNKIGGNKAKRIGRKFLNDDSAATAKTRFADVGEIYAVVSKLFGGGMVEATCIDGKIRLCIIRNKFKGRGKRDNMVKVGTWILVGPREYETSREKEKCDLLEVYNPNDMEKLKKMEREFNWNILTKISEANTVDDLLAGDLGHSVVFDNNYIDDDELPMSSDTDNDNDNDNDKKTTATDSHSHNKVKPLEEILGVGADDSDGEINFDDI